MDTVYKLILVLHFVGVAMVLGGFFAQMGKKPPVVTHWVRDGAFTQILTGFALVGIAPNLEGGEPFDNAAVGVKLVVAVIIAALALFGMRQEPEKQRPYWLACGVLALANIVVAVFWVAA
ncbi:MAG: hypothetical protein U0R68_00470 [Candidatus Nanopelagicales bacterium]